MCPLLWYAHFKNQDEYILVSLGSVVDLISSPMLGNRANSFISEQKHQFVIICMF